MKAQKHLLWAKLALIGWTFLLLAMAPPVVTEKAALKDMVKDRLQEMEVVYASRDFEGFIALLDKDFEPLGNFKNSLQEEFLNRKSLELKFIVDNILKEKEKILVKLHWFKKYTDPSGKFLKVKGESQFVFFRDSEGLKLLSIRGDNPFF
ncbi:MAG: hypothetical protein U9Q24_00905 [Candidatus Ratteibacteria bacterium]|nr:hypothetical protein [Candidatus Ratteibacteria bacterium]